MQINSSVKILLQIESIGSSNNAHTGELGQVSVVAGAAAAAGGDSVANIATGWCLIQARGFTTITPTVLGNSSSSNEG